MAVHLGATPAGVLRRGISVRQIVALATPAVLVVTMVAVFQGLVGVLGWPGGYLAGFGVYWLGWCLVLPAILLGGGRPLLALFREGQPVLRDFSWKLHAALWWPLIFPLLFVFIPKLGTLNVPILLVSALLGLTIGVTEEILWRGVYIRLFPEGIVLNTIYPAIGFALWHLAPQLVHTTAQPGGAASFILYALALGLSYAYVARRTGSIRWCTLSHIVHDTLGLGAFVYLVWLT